MSLLPEPLSGWEIRLMSGATARKRYTCPDCGGEIAPSVGHVVAWPEGRNDERRHWHKHCWRQFVRRGGDGGR